MTKNKQSKLTPKNKANNTYNPQLTTLKTRSNASRDWKL